MVGDAVSGSRVLSRPVASTPRAAHGPASGYALARLFSVVSDAAAAHLTVRAAKPGYVLRRPLRIAELHFWDGLTAARHHGIAGAPPWMP